MDIQPKSEDFAQQVTSSASVYAGQSPVDIWPKSEDFAQQGWLKMLMGIRVAKKMKLYPSKYLILLLAFTG